MQPASTAACKPGDPQDTQLNNETTIRHKRGLDKSEPLFSLVQFNQSKFVCFRDEISSILSVLKDAAQVNPHTSTRSVCWLGSTKKTSKPFFTLYLT
jgi:hypothetical protein